jgi:hypothetical protein
MSDENFEEKQRKRAEEELREVAMRKAKEAAQVKELESRRAVELKKAKKIQSYDILLAVKRKEYEQTTTMHAELEQKLRFEKRIADSLRLFMLDYPSNRQSALQVGVETFSEWQHVADAAGIQSVFVDLWSRQSIYIFGDTQGQLTVEHTEIVLFVQWLEYCFYMSETSDGVEDMMDKVKLEAKGRIEEDSPAWHYPVFHTSDGVRTWLMEERLEWVRKQFQQQVFVDWRTFETLL